MINSNKMTDSPIKYLTPDNLYDQLQTFTAGMTVTKGHFELMVDHCLLEDVEWNHMDQMHRLTIHNTYEKAVRIAAGKNFAISLTQWQKWPLFITVTDVYVSKGLFYQTLSIAGLIVIHSIISLEQVGDKVLLKDEWYIASHKFFRFLHGFLNKKLYKLNERLQQEDEPVRQGRYFLRKKGYEFKTDIPNYYNSNLLGNHTVYPSFEENGFFTLDNVCEEPSQKNIGDMTFVIKKTAEDRYLIWPAACPHEGGPLMKGKFYGNKIVCPWHGLQFLGAEVSLESPQASKCGFNYVLRSNKIYASRTNVADFKSAVEKA